MDTKKQKQIIIVVLVVVLLLAIIWLSSRTPATDTERRIDRIEKQISDIRAEIQTLEEEGLEDEDRATRAAELSRQLLEHERELREILGE